VTVWNSAPPVMELVVRDLEARGARFPDSLRLVMLSGDWIDVSLPDRVRALGAAVEVVSLGGATEASIWSIAYPIGRVDPAWRSIPYGRPLANQTWYVLDDSMRPCARGERGMLYIGGAGLARGYWNDAEKTASAFVADPHTGGRLYRTGDFGRTLDDGETLEILGREDTQVKIRGYRVELGEIEAALLACEGVRSARVVLDAERGPGSSSHSTQDLVAVVVIPGADAGAVTALRAQLRRVLPAHMVPGTIRLADALPLTENGKVDLKALAAVARRC
jgi:acyl-coenzyme A synthetase/AMP-(fatty) acid ligase